MKLWKGATLAFVLCAAALSTVLIRNMATIRQIRLKAKHPYTSSHSSGLSSLSESTSGTSSSGESREPSQQTGGLNRKIRSAGNNMNSLLSDFSEMFQSFTEGELQRVLGALIDKKKRQDQSLWESKVRRTKRARRPKPCSLRKLNVTVTELNLGYESDETVLVHYCSGSCTHRRQNYDIAMEKLFGAGAEKKRHRKKVSSTCCRPTAFDKGISYFGNKGFNTIQNVSAKTCECI